MNSAVELRIDPRDRPVGAGMVRRLLPHRTRRMVGPFVFADVIGPDTLEAGSSVDIDAHPHIGLSTWVALPSDAEEAAPSFHHVAADEIPIDNLGATTVRVAVGSGWDLDSPINTSSPLVLAEITLDAESPFPIATDHPEIAVIAMDGDVRVDDEVITSGQLAVLRADVATTLTGSGTAIVLGRERVGRRHIWWNFVHSDPDRIEQAKADWMGQRFPTVPNDHDPFVPLPA